MPYINKNVNECHINSTKKFLGKVIVIGVLRFFYII